MFVNVTTSNSQSSPEWVERVLSLALQTMYTVTGSKSLVESGLVPNLIQVFKTQMCPTFLNREDWCFALAQTALILETALTSYESIVDTLIDVGACSSIVLRLNQECKRLEKKMKNKEGPTHGENSLLQHLITLLMTIGSTISHHAPGQAQMGKNDTLLESLHFLIEGADTRPESLFTHAAHLLSDLLNNDPSTLKSVHESGLAEAYMRVLVEDRIPAVPEALAAAPGVLRALGLTTEMENKILEFETSPIDAIFSVMLKERFTECLGRDVA